MPARIATMFFLLFLLFYQGIAQDKRVYTTSRLNGQPPEIDGILAEDCWSFVEWQGDFIQREPYENQLPSQPTSFKVLFDDNHLYVAVRAHDDEPENIERRLSRRDQFEGDFVIFAVDSYFDQLTAFSFGVNAAGVKIDARVSNDVDLDLTWDPIWYVKVSIDEQGWVAEMKIPYNQIRFADVEQHIWGLEVMRWIHRYQEFSLWQKVAREASGWVSLWGELHGVNNIDPKKEISLTPYVMGSLSISEIEQGNPYKTGKDWGYNAGLDGKMAISNDFTLNITVNPDFGQVEADPSEVNLTAYESFFEEKRPFFIEGSNIYDFPISNGGGPSGRDNLFYSRRIGRRPSYEPDLEDDQYSKTNEFTRILGALKFSGKTRNGWSVGIMESFTNREVLKIYEGGNEELQTAEPLTNYFNTRVQKDINKGRTTIGGMVTATNRFINDTTIGFLPSAAYTWGGDFNQYWKNKAYYLGARLGFSYISGTSESITDLQESPRRYYQRPDAGHLEVDTSRTNLTGYGGSIEGSKIGKGNWRYGIRISWRSPGFELNDMGYLRTADLVHQGTWLRYVLFEPFGIFRAFHAEIFQWSGWDFSGINLYSGLWIGTDIQFTNYYRLSLGGSHEFSEISRSELRGGPALCYPGASRFRFEGATDNRKKLVGLIESGYEWGNLHYKSEWSIGAGVEYRPISSLQLSLIPEYEYEYEYARYVETIDLVSGKQRYLTAALKRNTAVLNIRVNLSLTPDLSIQYWGQPFMFSGDYSDYKAVTDAGNRDFYSQFYPYTENQIRYNTTADIYTVCENGFESDGTCTDPSTSFTFENPDFSVHDYRSNLVLRWEYIPGSTLYAVWSHGRNGDAEYGNFDFNRIFRNLLDEESVNIFLIKFSYRFSF